MPNPKKTTDQVRNAPNPTGKGGFADNPQNRNPGGWKKEDTLRFQVEQVAKMDDVQLQEVVDDNTRPRLVRNFASAVQKSQWREIKEMIEMLYGKPKESIDISNPDGSMIPTVRIIDDRPSKSPRLEANPTEKVNSVG